MKDRLKKVTKLRQEALHNRKVAISADPVSSVNFQIEAIYNEAAANELDHVTLPPTIVSGEVVPSETDMPDSEGGWALRNTLANPDTAALAASLERTELLSRSGTDVLALGIDAAASIPESSSLDTMLGHQLALAHQSAFKLMDRAMQQRDTVEMVRLVNASARMMSAYQQGLLALNRLHTGGRQIVTVQHASISGGQAVVTGSLQPGGVPNHTQGGRDEIED